MSIALQRNGTGGDAIRRPRLDHGDGEGEGEGEGEGVPCRSIYEDRRRLDRYSDSCSSSSIGRNSDLSEGSSGGGEYSGDEEEVQSSFKGPLDTMDALKEVLPINRGMSKFYIGKSKSFTSLADAVSFSSVKDIAKPENPYNKKRKNLLSHANLLDKTRRCSLQKIRGGTSKRPAFNQNTFLLSETTTSNLDELSTVSNSPSCSSLPPLHPHAKRSPPVEPSPPPPRQTPWRSFSLSDLQSACASTPNITGLVISTGAKKREIH